MQYKNKVVVITGGASGIGAAIARAFEQAGAQICVLDKKDNNYYCGDLADPAILENFKDKVLADYGSIDYLINNAPPLFKGINSCSYQDFQYALAVGLTAPFYLSKLFAPHFNSPHAAIVNISSSRDRMSQPQSESYTAAKGGITALTHALAMSFAGSIRVNSISPGWIGLAEQSTGRADREQHSVKRIGRVEDIAGAVLFLCSEQAGFINGENICIDGGMTHQMIYHGDHGWSYQP